MDGHRLAGEASETMMSTQPLGGADVAPEDGSHERVAAQADLMRQVMVAFATVNRSVSAAGEEIVAGCGLTPALAEMLWNLAPDGEPPAMKDLAAAMHCDRSNVTSVIDRLVRLGLVTRSEDPRDRRSRVIRLTEPGRAARATLVARLVDGSPFATMSEAELRDLLRLLGRVPNGSP